MSQPEQSDPLNVGIRVQPTVVDLSLVATDDMMEELSRRVDIMVVAYFRHGVSGDQDSSKKVHTFVHADSTEAGFSMLIDLSLDAIGVIRHARNQHRNSL